jgi:hypothetical protein
VVVARAKSKKDTLDSQAEPIRLTNMCQRRFAGDWHSFYSACDLQLVFDGAKPSVHNTTRKTTHPSKKYVRYVNAIDMMLSTLGIICDEDTT